MPVVRIALPLTSALITWAFWASPRGQPSDFAQLWFGARAWLAGENPYALIGPGQVFEWPWPLFYPFTSVLAAVPFSVFTLHMADTLMVLTGAAVLVFAFTRSGQLAPGLLVFASFPWYFHLQTSQWSPLLVGAAFIPFLGFVMACKPTLGAALCLAFPSIRLALGAAVFVVLSIILFPAWIQEWWPRLAMATHVRAPIMFLGGPIVLLALWQWRRPEARLLVALACIPHTPAPYELIPLFLVPRSWPEAAGICVLSWAVLLGHKLMGPYSTYATDLWAYAQLGVWCVYLPCTGLVLWHGWQDRSAGRG